MFPFNRKVKAEIDDAKPVKKVRRRKKAEPVKPWGKLERIIVFIFLAGIPALSFFFLNHSHNLSSPKVLGEITSRAPKDINTLKEQLTKETKNQKGTYGIWIQAIDNSYSFGINENDKFEGASIFKLPLMIAYYKAVDTGKIDPTTNYTIKYADAAGGAGIISNLPPGTVVTYKDMAIALGKNSDNTAFSILYNVLGAKSVTSVMEEIGMKNTDFENSITSPFDASLIYYKLINSNLISPNSRKDLFASLTNTDFETLIPKGVPGNVQVVHKYGSVEAELNDAGIVYTNKPFILVILAKDIDEGQAETEIPKITKIVYDWNIE